MITVTWPEASAAIDAAIAANDLSLLDDLALDTPDGPVLLLDAIRGQQPAPSPDPFRRALDAEPMLRAIDAMVDALVALAPSRRSGQPMCAGCIWDLIVKPLASPWVGWERGFHPDVAEDPRPDEDPLSLRIMSAADWTLPPRTDATTDTERWLRTSEAFDLVTDEWLRRLDAADPANGHGFPKAREGVA